MADQLSAEEFHRQLYGEFGPPLVIHITAKRYEKLRSAGWPMESAYNAVTFEKGPADADAFYHIGHNTVDDVWHCPHCHTMVQSVKADTPADLEAVKEELRRG